MENIVKFIIDDEDIRFYRNNNFSSKLNLIDKIDIVNKCHGWIKSNVSTSKGDYIDNNVRNSSFVDCFLSITDNLKKVFEENISKMVPEYMRSTIKPIENNKKVSILKYDQGNFFISHTDSKNNIICTCLIFPPVNMSNNLIHKGGILRISRPNGEIFEFDSSKNNNWTIILFEPTLQHECTQVLSGTRYVIKTSFEYTKLNNFLLKQKQFNAFDNWNNFDNFEKINNGLNQYKKEKKSKVIREFKEKIILFLNNKNDEEIFEDISNLISEYDYEKGNSEFNNIFKETYDKIDMLDDTNKKIEELVGEINKFDKENIAIVVLQIYYPVLDVRNLYREDYELMRTFNNLYKSVRLENINIQTIKKSGKYKNEELMYPLICDDFNEEKNNIFYQSDSIKNCGEISEYRSVYNDSDYDIEYEKNVTCIIINKFI
jgi:hypothetical protein